MKLREMTKLRRDIIKVLEMYGRIYTDSNPCKSEQVRNEMATQMLDKVKLDDVHIVSMKARKGEDLRDRFR